MTMSNAQRRLVLFATSVGSLLNPMIASMIILSLPGIGTEFLVSARDLGWMSTAFMLANVICIVPATRMVDIIGYRRSYVAGSVAVSCFCLLSVFAPNYPVLIFLRVLTGLGTAFVMITGLAILTRIYPREKRGFIIGINTAMVYVGASFGPVLGGTLTELFGWRSIFLLMAPLVLISAVLLRSSLKEEFREPVAGFDIKGTMLYGAAIFCLMYGLSTITDRGSAILVVAGVLLFVLFVRVELKTAAPVLRVSMFFTNKRFARSAYTALLNYGAVYGSVYFVSLYLQSVGQLTAIQAGMILLFQPLIQAVMTPIAGKISDKIEPRYLVTIGMALAAIGIFLLAWLGYVPVSTPVYIAVTQIFIGFGAALFAAPNTSAIMGAVSKRDYSTASGIVAVMRQVGMILSMAVCMSMIALFVGSTELLGPSMYAEFTLALQWSMIICAGLACAGILFSWFRGPAPAGEE